MLIKPIRTQRKKKTMKSLIKKLRELAKKLAQTLGPVAGAAAAALALLTATPASAQSPRSISFLSDGILAITVTNAIPYTNLLSVGSAGTNLVGLAWTNNYGSNIVAVGTNYEKTTLTRDISLWSDRNGATPTNANISGTFVAPAGNLTTNTLVFVPLYDGTNESTVASDAFIWSVTANGTAKVVTASLNPLGRWPGVQKIRCKTIASGTNLNFTVLSLNLNGFSP
jgi:hypothetical protein